MGEEVASISSAREIMRKWQWVRHDPDAFPLAFGLDLSEVVSRLAMAGQPRPHNSVLVMLCRGDLIAVGDFKWRKYQWGKFFQLEDYSAEVAANQWQTLQLAIEDEARELSNSGWPFFSIDLEKLGIEDCSPYEWNFGENRFSTALCPPDASVHDTAYFEEWFSAWNLEIRFPDGGAIAPDRREDSKAIKALPPGRPLAAWWPDFVAELVAYTVEVGLPDGIGHQGQSQVIKDVLSRLQERGKEEPSRSQLQEAVNAVLRRMRSAGN